MCLQTLLPDLTALMVDFRKPIPEDAWPPMWFRRALLDYLEWDRLLLALPDLPWFRAMMWADVVYLAGFYLVGMVAFWRGWAWIQNWCLIFGSHVLSYAVPLTFEQLWGPNKSPEPVIVMACYIPYWLFGVFLMWRMWGPEPFGAVPIDAEPGKKKKKKQQKKSVKAE